MALGIGQLFSGLARGAATGMQLNQNQQRIDLSAQTEERMAKIQEAQLEIAKEQLDLKRQTALNEILDMQEIAKLAGGFAQSERGQQQADAILKIMKGLANVDRGTRAALVDQYAAAFKQQYGTDLAPVVVATLKKAKEEDLAGMVSALEDQISGDPNMSAEQLVKTLTDPMAATDAIVNLSGASRRMMDRTAVQGPEATASALQRKRLLARRAQIEQRLAAVENGLVKIRSKAGLEKLTALQKSLQSQINSLDTQLTKDLTETRDLGDRIEIVDKMTGEVIDTKFKNPTPVAGSNKLFNVIDPKDNSIIGRAVFNSQARRPVMEDGSPVPPGMQLQGIGTGGQFMEITTPDGTVVRSGTGAAAGQLSKTTQGEMEKQIAASEQFALDVRELASRITASHVGIRGNLVEKFVNQVLAQVDPSMANTDVTEVRTKIRQIGETAVKIFGAPPFSNADREAAKRLVASEGWFTSEPEAKAMLEMVATISEERASYAAGKLGRRTIVDMKPEEILSAVKDGTLDSMTAVRALTYFHPEYLEEQRRKRMGADSGAQP